MITVTPRTWAKVCGGFLLFNGTVSLLLMAVLRGLSRSPPAASGGAAAQQTGEVEDWESGQGGGSNAKHSSSTGAQAAHPPPSVPQTDNPFLNEGLNRN